MKSSRLLKVRRATGDRLRHRPRSSRRRLYLKDLNIIVYLAVVDAYRAREGRPEGRNGCHAVGARPGREGLEPLRVHFARALPDTVANAEISSPVSWKGPCWYPRFNPGFFHDDIGDVRLFRITEYGKPLVRPVRLEKV